MILNYKLGVEIFAGRSWKDKINHPILNVTGLILVAPKVSWKKGMFFERRTGQNLSMNGSFKSGRFRKSFIEFRGRYG